MPRSLDASASSPTRAIVLDCLAQLRELHKAMRERSEAPSALVLSQLATALAKCSQEERQLADQEMEERVRRGQLVDRGAAMRVVLELADAVVTGVKGVAPAAAGRLREAGAQIGEGAARLDAEAQDRVVAAVLDEVAGELLGRLAGACERTRVRMPGGEGSASQGRAA